jgi:hypothetical protein
MSVQAVRFLVEGNNFKALERLNAKFPIDQQIFLRMSEECWEIERGLQEEQWCDDEGPRELIETDIRTLLRSQSVSADEIAQVWIHTPVMLAMMLINDVVTIDQLDALTEEGDTANDLRPFLFWNEKEPRLLDVVIDPNPDLDHYTFRRKDGSIIQ